MLVNLTGVMTLFLGWPGVMYCSFTQWILDGVQRCCLTITLTSQCICSVAGQSKLANILFAKQLAKDLQGTNVKAYSLHPGQYALPSLSIHHKAPTPMAGRECFSCQIEFCQQAGLQHSLTVVLYRDK